MPNGSDAQVKDLSTRTTACHFGWCDGKFCQIGPAGGERFHFSNFAAEAGGDDIVGVDLVLNEFADGTNSGPLVDITWSRLWAEGVTEQSALLTPQAALRHAAAVIRAAHAAIASGER